MKRKMFLLGSLALIVAGSIFWSCQKDEILVNTLEGVMLKAGTVQVDQADCQGEEGVCIDLSLETPVYYEKTYQDIVTWGNERAPKVKTVDLVVYNTESNFVIKFKSTHSPQNLYVNNVWILEAGQNSEGTWFTHTIPLENGWEACDLVEYSVSIDGQGSPATFEVEYSLIGICTDCDEFELTGKVECGLWEESENVNPYFRTATFKYTPAEDGWLKFQGGLTRWATDVRRIAVTGFNSYENETSNASVGGWKGIVTACTEYTFVVTWEYEKSNREGREMEDGNVIGDWTAELYEYVKTGEVVEIGVLVSKIEVEEMVCGDVKDGVIIFPIPVVE